jgi:uncharacterized membrane protein
LNDRARAQRILAFREEVATLQDEGMVGRDGELLAKVTAHHDAILADISAREEVDFTRSEARLSTGMRIATVLGAAALSAAWGFFVAAAWDDLGRGARLALVIIPPILLTLGTAYAARRESSGYVASIVATVAAIAFAVNLTALGVLYDLPDSRRIFLAVGTFAMLLAYGYGLAMPLLIGIGGIGGWLWSLAAIPQGRWWDGVFGQLEFLALLGVGAMLMPAITRKGPPSFALVWRAVGATGMVVALLFLGLTADASFFDGANRDVVEGIYQLLGGVVFTAMVWQGLVRDRTELVRVGSVGLALLLFFRMVDWFWDWIPKWLFFLVVGGIAFGALLLLRRLRRTARGVA